MVEREREREREREKERERERERERQLDGWRGRIVVAGERWPIMPAAILRASLTACLLYSICGK